MPRPCNPNLSKDWKIPLDAALAGAVEHELMNSITGKPRYGERTKIISMLLSEWLFKRKGIRIEVELPSPDLIPETKQ